MSINRSQRKLSRLLLEKRELDAELREWIYAWSSVGLVACLATAVWSVLYHSHPEASDESSLSSLIPRFLWENNVTYYTPAEAIEPSQHHHHHSVINEDHKPLFPLSSADIFGFGFAISGLLLAAGGGIGGGGMLVPIYCLVLGFSPKHAIPLSNVTVLGGAVANTLLNWPKRHPLHADKPLMDWDLILAMEPLTIAGALMGVILNKLLPELLLTVLLVVLLAVTARKTLQKAFKLYRDETKDQGLRADGTKESELTRLAHQDPEDDSDDEDDSDAEDNDEDAENNQDHDNHNNDNSDEEVPTTKAQAEKLQQQNKELQEIFEQERHPPRINIQILVVLFVVVLTINLLKGGGAFPSPLHITCGSTMFWLANLLLLVWIILVASYARGVLLTKHHTKLACGYPYEANDIVWDERNTVVYPCVCCLAGFFAGMFGIGGGIVKGPLMLAMGVHPAVSSASSACMILFTSFTATTSFLVFGLLLGDYAVLCFFVGLVSTGVGQVVMGIIMERAGGRSSFIAFSIGFVVLVSAILMTIQSLLSMAAGEHHHAGGICGKGD